MRGYKLIICVVFLYKVVLQAHANHGNKCTLPAGQDIKWNKMKGKWYEILNDGTMRDTILPCFHMSHYRSTSYGFTHIFSDDHLDTKRYSNIKMFVKKLKSGAYIWKHQSGDDRTIEAMYHEDHPHKRFKMSMRKAMREMYSRPIVYYTDYKSYSIAMRCDKHGKRNFWVLSPGPYPTAQVVLNVYNKLVTIGEGWNDIPLYLSQCAKTPGIKYYNKE